MTHHTCDRCTGAIPAHVPPRETIAELWIDGFGKNRTAVVVNATVMLAARDVAPDLCDDCRADILAAASDDFRARAAADRRTAERDREDALGVKNA